MNARTRTARSTALALLLAGTLAGCATDSAVAQSHGPDGDIVETAVAAGSFNTLAAALEAAGLVETLQGDGPFTVFAPTDEAFAALPEGTVETLLQPENRQTLVEVLTYHVVAGRVTADQVVQLDRATTVNGETVAIGTRNGGVQVNDANVVTTDVLATNGVIHVIDRVLLPSALRGQDAAARRSDTGPDRMRVRGADDAAAVLDLAIRRGVPLFNQGRPEGTAAIYEVASRAVLTGGFELPGRARRALEDALRQGEHTRDARDRAWIYRGGLDRALDEIQGRMAMRDRH